MPGIPRGYAIGSDYVGFMPDGTKAWFPTSKEYTEAYWSVYYGQEEDEDDN